MTECKWWLKHVDMHEWLRAEMRQWWWANHRPKMWLGNVASSSGSTDVFILSAAVCFSKEKCQFNTQVMCPFLPRVSIHRYILEFIPCIKGKTQQCSQSNVCLISVAVTLGLPGTGVHSKNLSVVDECKIKIKIISTHKMSLSFVILQYSTFSTST